MIEPVRELCNYHFYHFATSYNSIVLSNKRSCHMIFFQFFIYNDSSVQKWYKDKNTSSIFLDWQANRIETLSFEKDLYIQRLLLTNCFLFFSYFVVFFVKNMTVRCTFHMVFCLFYVCIQTMSKITQFYSNVFRHKYYAVSLGNTLCGLNFCGPNITLLCLLT